MHRSPLAVSCRAAACAAAAALSLYGTPPARAQDPPPPEAPAPGTIDPVHLRADLLRRMDADIDARAARDHLQARLLLDEALSIAYFGIDADPAADAKAMKITKVYPDTAAERAGLRPGDLLLSVGGAATTDKLSMGKSIRRFRPGDATQVVIARDGREQTLTVTLGKRPEEDEDEDEQFPELLVAAKAQKPFVADFETATAGEMPASFDAALGGHGQPPIWRVAKDAAGSRLRQEDADATGIRFPQALVRDFSARDVAASIRFRFAGGKQDRAAGVILRWQDPNNYLVARANAAENDLRIFRVANGVRKTLPEGRLEAPMENDAWHTITFRAEGPKLTATYDGKSVTSYDTYFGKGRVGLWTKSDAISDFDDVSFEALLPAAPPK